MADKLPTAPVALNVLELGYLGAICPLWDRAAAGDPVARGIYLKLKAAAIALGVVWYYGDPWPVDGKEPHPHG
jgi:hypothetical protein